MFSDFVSDVNIAAWHSLPFGRFLQAWPQYKVATIKLNQELLQMHHVPLKEKRRHAWAVSFTHFCPNTSRWHTGADVRASTSMIRLSSPIMNWSWILILSLINHFDHLLIFSLFLSVLSRVDMMFFFATQVFQISPGLFLGSEFGATDPSTIGLCKIHTVINLTSPLDEVEI